MENTEKFFDAIFEGRVEKGDLKARLEEMYRRGESVKEIVAAVRSMRKHMVRVEVDLDDNKSLLDIVGTGGDKKSSINISTIAAFVAAGAGCVVAKHCNKGVSSKFGSADLLEELGVDVNIDAEQAKNLIESIGICFMYAPLYHGAIGNAAGAIYVNGKARSFSGDGFEMACESIESGAAKQKLEQLVEVSRGQKLLKFEGKDDNKKS